MYNENQRELIQLSWTTERYLFASILYGADAISSVQTEYFHSPAHRAIHKAMVSLSDAGQKITLLSLVTHLQKNGDMPRVVSVATVAGLTTATDALREIPELLAREIYRLFVVRGIVAGLERAIRRALILEAPETVVSDIREILDRSAAKLETVK